MIDLVPGLLIAAPVTVATYAYVGYPALLRLMACFRPPVTPPQAGEWPLVSITMPAYNEAGQIRGAVESLLALDYPPEKRQILVVSDASTDGTDEIVAEYAHRGVELLRLPVRGGKGMAERAASARLRGEVVVNTDASIRIYSHSLKALLAYFADPAVGLASGRDVSVGHMDADGNRGESGYVGYEMWTRRLETQVGGIIGASGSFYAIRADLHRVALPGSLSRDFAAAMIAREHGYRAVSVDEAICLVPRTGSLTREYRRKVRTITRGMETLLYERHLLNPFRYGRFAWMLFSHKVCRWLVPWLLPLAVLGLMLLSGEAQWARWGLLLFGMAGLWGAVGWALAARGRQLPRALALPAFVLAGNVAAIHAGFRTLHGDDDSIWEPTRRQVLDPQ